jgi:hypothetical protein
MQGKPDTADDIEAQIWTRLIEPGNGIFPKAAAQEILAFNFTDSEKARMHDLAVRNGQGKLSATEKEQLKSYIRVANVLALLHAKAKRSLKK